MISAIRYIGPVAALACEYTFWKRKIPEVLQTRHFCPFCIIEHRRRYWEGIKALPEYLAEMAKNMPHKER